MEVWSGDMRGTRLEGSKNQVRDLERNSGKIWLVFLGRR